MNESDFEALREAGRRRRLTPGELAQAEAWLALHPEHRADWEAETQLNRALDGLADVPVPSNFTARVVAAARREAAVRERDLAHAAGWRSWLERFLPRPAYGVAAALALLCAGGLAWHQVRLQTRHQNARDLAVLSSAAVLPELQLLAADFDTLRRLPQAEDDELLAVLHEAVPTP